MKKENEQLQKYKDIHREEEEATKLLEEKNALLEKQLAVQKR